MEDMLTVADVSGPFREPREPVLSYDFAIQRPSWPTCHAVRIKVSIPAELEPMKTNILGSVKASPGQHLLLNQILSRRIADEKLQIVDREGMLTERRDVLIEPFVGPLAHLYPQLDARLSSVIPALRAEITARLGLKPA
jgi:hypothetical protein